MPPEHKESLFSFAHHCAYACSRSRAVDCDEGKHLTHCEKGTREFLFRQFVAGSWRNSFEELELFPLRRNMSAVISFDQTDPQIGGTLRLPVPCWAHFLSWTHSRRNGSRRNITWASKKIMNTSPQGSLETILVVDDNPDVLKVVVMILEAKNYEVLAATSAEGALRISHERPGPIHMLLSDVDLPGISGPDLGEKIKESRPDIHVMLMSGGHEGNLLVLNYGWAYIQKPFVGSKLGQMVFNVLNTKNRSQPGGQEYDSRKDMANPGGMAGLPSGEEK